MARTLVRTIITDEIVIQDLVLTSITVVTLPGGSSIDVDGIRQNLSGDLTIDTTIVGAGGVDATIAADSIYSVYLILDGGVPKLIASLNDIQPSGFDKYTKIGRFFTNASSEIVQVSPINFNNIRFPVKHFASGLSQWTIYSDGWVKQHGFKSGEGTQGYTITMLDTNYSIQLTKNSFSIGAERSDWGITARTTTSFTVDRGTGGGSGFFWIIEGYGDLDSIASQGVILD